MSVGHASEDRRAYLPALKYRWLTPLYDPVLRFAFREDAMKDRLVAQIDLRPGQRVLDIGCGTGTLAIRMKRTQPAAAVVGLDGDPVVLNVARRKAANDGVDVTWDLGMAQDLPYPDEAFDAVVTSLMLHHLTPERKGQALREVCRVLRPGGSFHAADFGPPQNRLMRSLAKISELLEHTEDGVEGRLPGMFRDAGLSEVEGTGQFMTPMGTLTLYRARKIGGNQR